MKQLYLLFLGSLCCALPVQAQNRLWAWGGNAAGQLGLGVNYRDTLAPVIANAGTTNPKWIFLSAETSTSLGIKQDGSLWAWGSGTQGQLGNDSTGIDNVINTPILIDNGSGTHGPWIFADEGGTHSLGIRQDGSLWAWGSNSYGKLGNGNTTNLLVPTLIDPGTGPHGKWTVADAGLSHSMALRADSTLWTWGYNAYGQLGLSEVTYPTRYVPTLVDSGVAGHGKFIQISSTAHHNTGIRADGSLWAWGWNAYGNVGNNAQLDVDSIIMIDAGTGTSGKWRYISSGYYHNVGLRQDSTLWGWGRNNRGQLANSNTTSNILVPQLIDNGATGKWTIAECGQNHTLGIRADKSFWAWGYNQNGQLGDSSTIQRTAPVNIAKLGNLVNPVIRAGINYTIVLELAEMALPVKLAYFTAHRQGDQALLQWQTTAEQNNKGFYIQRSNNAADWATLGFAAGRSNSASAGGAVYAFTDAQPQPGVNYYRLQQTDLDGTRTYSDVRLLRFNAAEPAIQVFPNPVTDKLSLLHAGDLKAIRLTNTAGQAIQVKTVQQQNGSYTVDVSHCTPGLYLLQLLLTNGEQHTIKFIRQ
jgi:alpha-tubulin suppressor-like RCC1 family protein